MAGGCGLTVKTKPEEFIFNKTGNSRFSFCVSLFLNETNQLIKELIQLFIFSFACTIVSS